MTMPGVDGLAVCHLLRADACHTPGADADCPAGDLPGLDAGAVGYLPKPIELDERAYPADQRQHLDELWTRADRWFSCRSSLGSGWTRALLRVPLPTADGCESKLRVFRPHPMPPAADGPPLHAV